jgi:hypothetical protein
VPVEVPTLEEYAAYLSVDPATLGAKDTQALTQSAFLLGFLTGCGEKPSADPCKTLFENGIFNMAQYMAATQQYVAVVASPFQSETIGSYSYSKGFRNALLQGLAGGPRSQTGVFWFDLAVSECGCGEEISLVSSDAITVFEHENVRTDSEGRRWVLGPADAGGAAGWLGGSGFAEPHDPS